MKFNAIVMGMVLVLSTLAVGCGGSIDTAPPQGVVAFALDPKFTQDERLAIGEAMGSWNAHARHTKLALDDSAENHILRSTSEQIDGYAGWARATATGFIVDLAMNFPQLQLHDSFRGYILHELGHIVSGRNDHIPQVSGPAVMTPWPGSYDLTERDVDWCGQWCQ